MNVGADTATPQVDRAALVRAALRRMVAERGFHGASMSAVAKEAGVATGTAYVHYESKDELVVAAYVELKHDMGRVAAEAIDPTLPPEHRFMQVWKAAHAWLREEPDRARFMMQVDASPYAPEIAARVEPTALEAEAETLRAEGLLLPLPEMVLYDLAFGPMLRVTAAERELTGPDIDRLAAACWRAITATRS